MTITIQILSKSGAVNYANPVSFFLERERYTPYSFFSGVVNGSCVPENVLEIRVYYGSSLIHDGIADSVICEKKNGTYFTSIRSYGFSMLLGQNQSEPGMISSPDLETIVKRNSSIYGVTYESGTSAVNYVYIEDKTTLWNAICVYAMKAYSNYPYVAPPNKIYCQNVSGTLRDYGDKKIVFAKKGVKLTNLISNGFTANVSGDWSYTQSDTFATERHIKKYKYYARSSEWLYNLNNEILYHMNYASRGRVYYTFTYNGYDGEKLLDRATLTADDNFSVTDMEIDRVRVSGSSKGIFTTVSCYVDKYCNV